MKKAIELNQKVTSDFGDYEYPDGIYRFVDTQDDVGMLVKNEGQYSLSGTHLLGGAYADGGYWREGDDIEQHVPLVRVATLIERFAPKIPEGAFRNTLENRKDAGLGIYVFVRSDGHKGVFFNDGSGDGSQWVSRDGVMGSSSSVFDDYDYFVYIDCFTQEQINELFEFAIKGGK